MGSRLHDTAVQHVLRTGTLLTICGLAYANAQAQSFDCNKASTPIEHAICDDESLGKLDLALARDFNRMLEAEPQRRQALLADQRRWLAYRDKRCDNASSRDECISNVYRNRIEHLQSRSVPAAAICHRLADSRRPIANAQGKSSTGALVNEPPPVFVGEADLPHFGNPVAELPAWAKEQNPPFVIDPELIAALEAIDDGTIGHLHNLPGTNLYAITHEQGSAHCYVSQFFAVEAGHARPVATPPMIEDEGGTSCYVYRGHGRIDGMPAITQSGMDFDPEMSSIEIVVLWDGNMIPSACAITSWYSPEFGKPRAVHAKEECDGPLCDGLRAAALKLVEAVQENPRQAHERLKNSLAPAQKLEFDAAVGRAISQRGHVPREREPTLWEPEYITIDDPLFLPYLHAGQVYVAGVGHETAYGNTFADWRVEFEFFRNGERVQFASFPVGMKQGELEDVSVATRLR